MNKLGFASIALVPAVVAVAALGTGKLSSGIKVGENVSAFMPHHVTGADANTNTCPVCKYGMIPAVQVWVNGDSPKNVEKIAKDLDARIHQAGDSNHKGFIVFVEPTNVDKTKLEANLKAMAADANLHHVALTYVTTDNDAIKDYQINLNPGVKNTVFVYNNRKVESKFVNLNASKMDAFNTALTAWAK